jgi:hypothetical protein
LPNPQHFSRFSATTAEERRAGAVIRVVLASLFFDMERAVLRWVKRNRVNSPWKRLANPMAGIGCIFPNSNAA